MDRFARLARRLVRLAGPLLLLIILSRIDLGRTLEMLRAIRFPYLLGAVALYPCLILLKSWRWRVLLQQQGISYGLLPAFTVYNSALAAGYVTPGRLGEFVKALYLSHDTGITLGHALSSVVLDRLLDLYLLLASAAVGSMLFSVPQALLGPAFSLLAAGMLGPLLVLLPGVTPRITSRFAKVVARWTPTKNGQEGSVRWAGFYRGIEQLLTFRLLAGLACTAIAYGLFYSQCYLLAMALGLSLPFLYCSYCVALASLVALLPVSISGLGVRDATFVALFGAAGLPAETAVSYSLLFLAVFSIVGGLAGAVAWSVKPLR